MHLMVFTNNFVPSIEWNFSSSKKPFWYVTCVFPLFAVGINYRMQANCCNNLISVAKNQMFSDDCSIEYTCVHWYFHSFIYSFILASSFVNVPATLLSFDAMPFHYFRKSIQHTHIYTNTLKLHKMRSCGENKGIHCANRLQNHKNALSVLLIIIRPMDDGKNLFSQTTE